ncbi:low-temperature-induced 65 kDa protein-like isoform X2 [Diospyros lotus]|uniref:low-temperature-induced 65 kDa protein-like isoform X2 n=1 Tax=Diospyros lotus TaxID=55363 RepID=UPI00224CDE9D|nr:low-temperature-induced 65 kDa protein-like isoform X2 [Diospyros lotus]
MESRVPRHHDDPHGEHLPATAGLPAATEGGHEEHHHEKPSVMQKVKARAKMIKETIKKHGHGHDQDDHQSHEEEEEEDDEEKMVQDPEVHGSPMYESATVRSGAATQQPAVVNLEEPTMMAEDRYDTNLTEPAARPLTSRLEEHSGQEKVELGRSIPGGLEEDPQEPINPTEPSNYQSKATDPTGDGGEAGISPPILQALDKMSVSDEPESKPKPDVYTGSHDQFSPEPLPPSAAVNPADTGSALKSFDSSKPEDAGVPFTKRPSDQSSYTGMVSSVTSTIADKAAAAKNVVASKLGYGRNEAKEESGKPTSSVAEKLAPEYEKAANVGSSVAAKVPGRETGDQRGGEKGASVKEYLAEKLRPGDEDKALSEAISSALHKPKQEQQKAATAAEEEEKPVAKVTTSEGLERRLGSQNEDLNKEAAAAEEKPVAKVTASEGLKRRLGSQNEDLNKEAAEEEKKPVAKVTASEGLDKERGAGGAGGMAMVGKVKGVVGSWFGMGSGDQSQNSQQSQGTTHGSAGGEDDGEQQQRRLKESAN